MSRNLRTATSSTSLRGQLRASASSPTKATAGTPSRSRVSASTTTKQLTPAASRDIDGKTSPTKERLSLKEQIALKRAEAKKAQVQRNGSGNNMMASGDDEDLAMGGSRKAKEDVVELGRWSVREIIERARSTGNVNLSSRSLVCIPSCLFEIHLGVSSQPLKSVKEPDYGAEDPPRRPRQNREQPSWFEAQDLVVLKAGNNAIVEIQPEISLFGSLKVVDLHSNIIQALPASFTMLSSLTSLDLSNNKLCSLPPPIFSLPSLSILNLSHNRLTSLPFSQFNDTLDVPSMGGDFFTPEISRADEPLPKLLNLDVGHNELSSASIDHTHLPASVTHLNLEHNPLGKSSDLLNALSALENLQELHMEGSEISDDSFDGKANAKFPKLQLLDLGETQVSGDVIRTFFSGSGRESRLNFEISTAPPFPGELRIIVGKRVVREAWEIEAEQRYLKKKKSAPSMRVGAHPQAASPTVHVKDVASSSPRIEKEPWEIEAEQGLTTEAERRRARAAAIASSASNGGNPASHVKRTVTRPREVQKEAWEIEAEQGLLTEGGRRRARAQQALSSSTREAESPPSPATTAVFSLANSNYYSSSTLALTLPPSAPPTRGHARAFSLVSTIQERKPEDLLVPVPTFPLNVIAKQNFASTLTIITLSNRRADTTFTFPSASFISSSSSEGGVLPRLRELYLEGCALGDTVQIIHEADDERGSPTSQKASLLELIADTFPSLHVLDLSYNSLTSDAITPNVLKKMLMPSSADGTRKALQVMRLRGNRLSSLSAFETVSSMFKGNRQVQEWKLEELDVRDNEISKLPVLLGLLPLDVFLVDGNTFRVPPRKVWEREGTKGLLSWLRTRIE